MGLANLEKFKCVEPHSDYIYFCRRSKGILILHALVSVFGVVHVWIILYHHLTNNYRRNYLQFCSKLPGP